MPISKAALKVKESEVQRAWLNILDLNNVVHWRFAVSGVPQMVKGRMIFKKSKMAGFPDTCGLTPKAKFWAAEIKSKTGRLTNAQEDWILRLEKAGALVTVIYNLSDCLTFLKQIKEN